MFLLLCFCATTVAVDDTQCAAALASCSSHGTCVDDKQFGGLKCVCDAGFSGNKCATGPLLLEANTPQKSVVRGGQVEK